jgi:hypothetical protein
MAQAMASGFENLKPFGFGLAYFAWLGLASGFWAKPTHH